MSLGGSEALAAAAVAGAPANHGQELASPPPPDALEAMAALAAAAGFAGTHGTPAIQAALAAGGGVATAATAAAIASGGLPSLKRRRMGEPDATELMLAQQEQQVLLARQAAGGGGLGLGWPGMGAAAAGPASLADWQPSSAHTLMLREIGQVLEGHQWSADEAADCLRFRCVAWGELVVGRLLRLQGGGDRLHASALFSPAVRFTKASPFLPPFPPPLPPRSAKYAWLDACGREVAYEEVQRLAADKPALLTFVRALAQGILLPVPGAAGAAGATPASARPVPAASPLRTLRPSASPAPAMPAALDPPPAALVPKAEPQVGGPEAHEAPLHHQLEDAPGGGLEGTMSSVLSLDLLLGGDSHGHQQQQETPDPLAALQAL